MILQRRAAGILFALVSVVVLASACGDVSVSFTQDVEATGDIVTTAYDLDGFDAVDIGSAFDATITVGDVHDVEIVSNESLVDDLDVRVTNGELRISLRRGRSISSGTLEAIIQVPELTRVEASGATSVEVVGAFGPDQTYSASGASELVVNGAGSTVRLEASGASDVTLRLDNVQTLDVELSGASSVDVHSAERVTGSLSGASDLTVPDQTNVDVSTSGASDINRD